MRWQTRMCMGSLNGMEACFCICRAVRALGHTARHSETRSCRSLLMTLVEEGAFGHMHIWAAFLC